MSGKSKKERNYQIAINVKTQFLENQSDVENHHYAFAYTITIKNIGTVSARLISRHWIITDANKKIQEVRGEGVVGEQPFLIPGESFRYTSGTWLETPVGTMHGSYQMVAEDGTAFDAAIERFTLSVPRILH